MRPNPSASLAQGILLERVHEGRVWVQLHPLAEPATATQS